MRPAMHERRPTGSGCGPCAQFFERIIEWDWPDAPPRNPVLGGDIPKKPEPLPKFLDDRDAAKLMAAARASPDPRDRLVVELLARTGMRAGELADLDADAVVRIGAGPTGCASRWASSATTATCHCTPQLVTLLAAWTAANAEHIRRHKRLVADHRGAAGPPRDLPRSSPRRPPRRGPASTPTGCATPWPPRRSTAACASKPSPRLLGHRSMEMTLIYACIANRVVADEYAAVSAKIDALYGQPPALPADYETTGMARLRREAHARMLGNGLCTRPAELDCRMESACETCAYFRTGTEFLPILIRQRDHARDHGQTDRAALFDGLIQRAENRTELTTCPRSPSTWPTRPSSPRCSPSSPAGFGQPETGPRRQLRRLRRPPRLQHRHPLRRPAPVRLPPRRQRRRRTLRRADTMITKTGAARPLDRITRITPIRRG